MKRLYFGTDGVRGPYGGPVINEEFAARLGFAAARHFAAAAGGAGGRALLARDTRASGAALLDAVSSGFAAAGLEPGSLGVLPTPAVALAVARQNAVVGAMITASHNPAADNGIKFFDASGFKPDESAELAIESLLPAGGTPLPAHKPVAVDALPLYLSLVKDLLPPGALKRWQIVLDTANGATCVTSQRVLREFGATVVAIGATPDGSNINAGVGSEHPEQLASRVQETGARLGIAHDGDGDRCVLVDEKGVVLDGDEILTILAMHALAKRALARNTLVVTVQSNLGVDLALGRAGGRVLRTAVGDRNVAERMRAEGAMLGGESSGHVICAEVAPAGDGLVAALKIIAVMRETGRPLSELRRVLVKAPQRSVALRVAEKKPLESLPGLGAAIAALERELGDRGRLLVRYSGTEPKLRLLVEGPAEAVVEAGLGRLVAAARAELEVIE